MTERNDNYETPQYLAEWAIDHVLKSVCYEVGFRTAKQYKGSDLVILEPGSGLKAPFATAACRLGYSSIAVENREIINKSNDPLKAFKGIGSKTLTMDFLGNNFKKFVKEDKFNIIATNPPFSKAEEFIQRSFEVLHPFGVMIFLLKLPFLASLKRMNLFEKRPPREVWVIQRRPSFTENSKTDVTEYAFYVWLGSATTSIVSEYNDTYLKWLDNKSLEKKWKESLLINNKEFLNNCDDKNVVMSLPSKE